MHFHVDCVSCVCSVHIPDASKWLALCRGQVVLSTCQWHSRREHLGRGVAGCGEPQTDPDVDAELVPGRLLHYSVTWGQWS